MERLNLESEVKNICLSYPKPKKIILDHVKYEERYNIAFSITKTQIYEVAYHLFSETYILSHMILSSDGRDIYQTLYQPHLYIPYRVQYRVQFK